MAVQLDSRVFVAPQFLEVFNGDILITPTGGTQGRLADKLGGAATTLSARKVVSNATGSLGLLPANAFILYVLLVETAGNAVSVGVGTASGDTSVAAPSPVPANGSFTIPAASMANWFSRTASQALFLSSPSWGGASIDATLVYQIGPS